MNDDIYQEIILDHNKSPRNFGTIAGATGTALGFNRLCGDKLFLQVKIDEGIIQDLAFKGEGCAISVASASMMTEQLKGKTPRDAEILIEDFQRMLTQGEPTEPPDLGELEAFSGVSEYPMRVKCATLAWHTLRDALMKSS